MTELVRFKKNHPKDTHIEQELKLWKGEATSSTIPNYIVRILGIFRRNYAPLDMHIHVSSAQYKTVPIKEPILLAIRNDPELVQRERDAIDLMAYGAERRRALSMLSLENVHFVENSNTAILDIPARRPTTWTKMAPQAKPEDENRNIANIIIPIREMHTSGVHASYLDLKSHAHFTALTALRDFSGLNRREKVILRKLMERVSE